VTKAAMMMIPLVGSRVVTASEDKER